MNNAVTKGPGRPLLFNGFGAFHLGTMLAPRGQGAQEALTSRSNAEGKISQSHLNVNDNDFHFNK